MNLNGKADNPLLALNQRNSSVPEITAVDLFCGVGGLTCGLVRGGIRVVAGVDIDSQCRFPYESNNGVLFVERSVRELAGNDIIKLFGDSKLSLLAGCAPCQPFSTYSRNSRKGRLDAKWDLVADFGRLVKDAAPDFVTMENVPQLLDHVVFKKFLEELKGYNTWWKVIDCSRFGVPQTRKRLVLLASRLGPIELIPLDFNREKAVTVRTAISQLPQLAAGEADPHDPLHVACRLSELNLLRIKASKPGGTWRDWDQSLIANCHRKASGDTYPSVYGRMKWDGPAPTITTQSFGFGNGRFGHPEQDRAITLREAAILQSFPDNYQFLPVHGKVRFSVLGRLIGNAVPVRVGEAIGNSLIKHALQFYLPSKDV